MFLRHLVTFLHFETYAFSNPQKAVLPGGSGPQLDFLPHMYENPLAWETISCEENESKILSDGEKTCFKSLFWFFFDNLGFSFTSTKWIFCKRIIKKNVCSVKWLHRVPEKFVQVVFVNISHFVRFQSFPNISPRACSLKVFLNILDFPSDLPPQKGFLFGKVSDCKILS